MNVFNKALKKYKTLSVEVKASFFYTVCSVLQKCLSFITLPLFTRLLSVAQYGQYTVYSSWLSIFSIFITLNLSYGTFNTAMVKFKDNRDGYIASIQGISTILATICLIVCLVFHELISVWLDLPTVLIVVMICECLFSFSYLCWCAKSRFEYKYMAIVVVTLVMAVASPVVAYILVCNVEEKGYARIIGYAGVTILIGLYFYVYNFVKGKSFFNKDFWKYALRFNVPLIIYYLSQSIFNQSDRLMINYYCGEEQAAMYSVAYNFAIVLTFVINAIDNAYIPWLYRKIETKDVTPNRKVACGIALLVALLLSFVVWLAPEIVWLMAGDEYTEAVWVVPPVTVSLLLLLYTSFSTNIEFLYEKKVGLVLASVGSAILNLVLNAIFIPRISYIAAGYTTLVSYIIFALANYLVILKYVKKGAPLHGIYNTKMLLLILIAFMILSGIALLLYNYFFIRLAVMLVAIIALVIFRKKIVALIKCMKGRDVSCSVDNETKVENIDTGDDNV